MRTRPEIKPTHKPIKDYYAALAAYAKQRVKHESALRSAFQNLLADIGRKVGWTLIPELSAAVSPSPYEGEGRGGVIAPSRNRPDGTFRDDFYIERGHWEAKDTDDDLESEIKKKIKRGYPLTNIIFEDTRAARLYQNGKHEGTYDLTKPQSLSDLLTEFFAHTEPAHDNFEKAVDEFKQRVPELARGLVELIAASHRNNPPFIEAFNTFFELCKSSLNPNLSAAAVDEMLVQHLLTERLIRTIFDNQDFTRRNVIAAEVEKVIDALMSRSFNRHDYLKQLDRFYLAIEAAARTISSFSEKQHFLNIIYERFFQGYSVKVADTHGIVYTPQEIVDFMCASVEEVLQKEFGRTVGDKDVNILDPCTGTGNFIVNLINRIPKRDLPRVYKEQLFANEVMLLPYYIAALNIEHAYYERTGQYEPFEGLCFVDSLDLAESRQADLAFMTEENTARVERQKKAPITVIVGNPPYNMGQQNENDNNKNRKYPTIDTRIQYTYVRGSAATLHTKLYDPYVRFFRWASDRLHDRDGIVCFVTNNSFVEQIAFDAMRGRLLNDFGAIFHLDLQGNVRHNPTLSGTAYNVFGIQVGVGITVAIKKANLRQKGLKYFAVPLERRREEKLAFLARHNRINAVDWQDLRPDRSNTWLIPKHATSFEKLVPISTKDAKAGTDKRPETVFQTFSLGVNTARDEFLYSFSRTQLIENVSRLCDAYSAEIDRYNRKTPKEALDNFLDYSTVKWSSTLKAHLARLNHVRFDENRIVPSEYRPFTKLFLYYDAVLIDRPGHFAEIFPQHVQTTPNKLVALTGFGSERPFMTLMCERVTDLHLVGAGCGTQCFPFYTYDDDGTNRRENITDWALRLFRDKYDDKKITKWDIFYFVYGLLHHHGYREKFADNLKRELPRISLAKTLDEFRAFREAGKALAKLHVEYESVKEWPLKWIETPGQPLTYRVEKMKLSKDKKSLVVNDSLILEGIPPEVFDYRLGNRSALDWVIDQYQASTDKRSGITSDPNRPDDPEYIVRLVGQVIRVSVETVKIVNALPKSYGGPP